MRVLIPELLERADCEKPTMHTVLEFEQVEARDWDDGCGGC